MSNELHDKIMNIGRPASMSNFINRHEMEAYAKGHQEARHAAAELALGYVADPSVASGAQELPPLPKPFFYYEANADESVEWNEACVCIDDVYTNAEYAAENETHGGRVYSEAQMQAYAQAAILANSAPNKALVEALQKIAGGTLSNHAEPYREVARAALNAAGVEGV